MPNMQNKILSDLRNCETKNSWKIFFQKYSSHLEDKHAPLKKVFQKLTKDPLCKNYPEQYWEDLLKSCLNNWNLDLGSQIAEFISTKPNANILILSAEIFLHNGQPERSKYLAKRGLRLRHNTPTQRLKLEILICNSYLESGQYGIARNRLTILVKYLDTNALEPQETASLLVRIARAYFFLGEYLIAAKQFQEASQLQNNQSQANTACQNIFNAAACYHNAGHEYWQHAFELLETCSYIAKSQGFDGIHAHCLAFHGTVAHQQCSYSEAIKNYKEALAILPNNENSFRRTHILSMLSFSYMRNRQYSQGLKTGQATLKIAYQDLSDRFSIRYKNLESQMLWIKNKRLKSFHILEQEMQSIPNYEICTLEQLDALAQYYKYRAKLGLRNNKIPPLKIDEKLCKNSSPWAQFLYARSINSIIDNDLNLSRSDADQCREIGDHENIPEIYIKGSLAILLIKAHTKKYDDEFHEIYRRTEESIHSNMLQDLKVYLTIFMSCYHYHQGQINITIKKLQEAYQQSKNHHDLKIIICNWIKVLKGHAPLLYTNADQQLFYTATQLYFAPNFYKLNYGEYLVSHHYTVDIQKSYILNQLIEFLIKQPKVHHKVEVIQQEVWRQSIHATGWQQKIRNHLTRMRRHFYTSMAPIIVQNHNTLRFNYDAIILT